MARNSGGGGADGGCVENEHDKRCRAAGEVGVDCNGSETRFSGTNALRPVHLCTRRLTGKLVAMTSFRLFLASLDPRMFYAATAGLVWLVIYAWRKVSIASWDVVTRKSPLLQNLPAVVLAGLISAAPAINKSFVNTLFDVIYGALAGGALSVFSHHVMKDSPLPYQGGGPAPKPAVLPEQTTLPLPPAA